MIEIATAEIIKASSSTTSSFLHAKDHLSRNKPPLDDALDIISRIANLENSEFGKRKNPHKQTCGDSLNWPYFNLIRICFAFAVWVGVRTVPDFMKHDLSRLKILLIEDSSTLRTLVQQILWTFDIKDIETVASAEAGLQRFKDFQPDIIIVDWALDGLNGLEFIKLVRLSDDSPNSYVPIIMLTGHTERQSIVEARDAGINEFLAKPITARALYSRLVAVIESPRPFIRTRDYFGPDRRRRKDENYAGEERRGQDDAIEL